MPNKPVKYNVRVYGVLLNSKGEVLVLNEVYKGMEMKKFPGGGHMLGEGLKDCLRREFIEELNIPVLVGRHLYTTDFLQISAFDDKEQLLSVYYLVEPIEKENWEDLIDAPQNAHTINWVPLHEIADYDFTFPIDKKVGKMLDELLA